MKSSAFSRTLELAKLAAKVGIKEVRSGNFKSRLEQAALIANSLSNLKGAAMKAGQLLSLDLNHYFPPEAIEILSQLQNSAVAQPYEQIEKILQQELGDEKMNRLENISRNPLGIASIGQVHRAQYRGRNIVLKVQYPGVADSIDSDLRILKTLALSFCQLTGRRMNLEPLFQEFRTILQQEVDYQKEAQLQREYKSRIGDVPTSGFAYRVPEVIEELSTGHVLGMSFETGTTLRSWINENHPKNQKQALASAVLDLYFHEFFDWGLVQTDPNWANFLVDQGDSKPELVLLDFGATRKYSRDFIENYIHLLKFAAEENFADLRDLAIEFGLIDHRESKSAFQAFEEMLKTAIRPFFASGPAFDFSDPAHSLNSHQAAKNLAEELIYSPPPYDLVFLHRKLAGVYSILKGLGVQLDVHPYWQKMLSFSSRQAES